MTCTCYYHYSVPGSEYLTLKVVTEEIEADRSCASLNSTTTSATSLITEVARVGGQ